MSFGNPQYKGHLEDFGIDGRIILKLILVKTACEVVDETSFAEDRFLWLSTGSGNIPTFSRWVILTSQDLLCNTGLVIRYKTRSLLTRGWTSFVARDLKSESVLVGRQEKL